MKNKVQATSFQYQAKAILYWRALLNSTALHISCTGSAAPDTACSCIQTKNPLDDFCEGRDGLDKPCSCLSPQDPVRGIIGRQAESVADNIGNDILSNGDNDIHQVSEFISNPIEVFDNGLIWFGLFR